jgi:hypothetical protein
MAAQRKCGQTIRSKDRHIIANIIKFCVGEAQQKYLSVSVAIPIEGAAEYCNVPSGTLQHITA